MVVFRKWLFDVKFRYILQVSPFRTYPSYFWSCSTDTRDTPLLACTCLAAWHWSGQTGDNVEHLDWTNCHNCNIWNIFVNFFPNVFVKIFKIFFFKIFQTFFSNFFKYFCHFFTIHLTPPPPLAVNLVTGSFPWSSLCWKGNTKLLGTSTLCLLTRSMLLSLVAIKLNSEKLYRLTLQRSVLQLQNLAEVFADISTELQDGLADTAVSCRLSLTGWHPRIGSEPEQWRLKCNPYLFPIIYRLYWWLCKSDRPHHLCNPSGLIESWNVGKEGFLKMIRVWKLSRR